MGKRQHEGAKSGAAGRKKGKRVRSGAAGTKCQIGFVIYPTRQEAAAASANGRAKRCGRCRQWHAEVS